MTKDIGYTTVSQQFNQINKTSERWYHTALNSIHVQVFIDALNHPDYVIFMNNNNQRCFSKNSNEKKIYGSHVLRYLRRHHDLVACYGIIV